jgi:hypothetical protein
MRRALEKKEVNKGANNIDDFSLWRCAGRESKPMAAINVDIVKPTPAISETLMLY